MQNNQNADSELDYTALAAALFDQYGPAARTTIETASLPDELVSSDREFVTGELGICDQNTGETLAIGISNQARNLQSAIKFLSCAF